MGASPPLFLITEGALPLLTVAIMLSYIAVPETMVLKVLRGQGCLVVIDLKGTRGVR